MYAWVYYILWERESVVCNAITYSYIALELLELWMYMQQFFRSSFSLCLFVSLSNCQSVCLSDWLSVCLSVSLSDCLSVYQYVCLTVCLSISQSVCLSVCLSISQSVCLSDCLSVCLSVCLTLKMVDCLSWKSYYCTDVTQRFVQKKWAFFRCDNRERERKTIYTHRLELEMLMI